MARFEDSIDYVLHHEGGYSDHPADPGGMTQWGISLRFLRATGHDIDGDGDIDGQDIRDLTINMAIELYFVEFWEPLGLDEIEAQPVATKILDLAVNTGAGRAVRIVQSALGKIGHKVKVDGGFGPITRAAVNEADPVELLDAIRKGQAAFYRRLAKKKPDMKVFLAGWLVRAAA